MNSPSASASVQYELVKSSRKVLLDYCRTISPADFLNQHSSFGRGGSIRNLLIHVANVYEFWVAHFGLGKEISYSEYESFKTIGAAVDLYGKIDGYVQAFIEDIMDDAAKEIPYELSGSQGTVKPMQLFTHVITLEFHHKGQILSLKQAVRLYTD